MRESKQTTRAAALTLCVHCTIAEKRMMLTYAHRALLYCRQVTDVRRPVALSVVVFAFGAFACARQLTHAGVGTTGQQLSR